VRVDFSGIDLSQDIFPLIKSFYPNAEVKAGILEENEEQDREGNDLHIKIESEESGFRIFYGDEAPVGTDFVYEDVPDARMSYEKRKRRAYKNLLLREMYKLLSLKTGKELPWGILTGVRPTKLCFERLKTNTVGNISYMMKEYLCSPKKAGMAQKIAARELEILKGFDHENGYSLYVGFPFCPSICNYCSFGAHPLSRYGHLAESYIEALLKEIDECSVLLPDKKLQTIYFGGGTPTAVSCDQLKRVIERVKTRFPMEDVLEFCVEAGRPDSIDEEKLFMMKEEGVSRISINPQSMRQKTLDAIGRGHTVEQIVKAFEDARRIGFDNINTDLIAGLTGECFEDMKYTLDEVNKLSPDCITVHTLALKRAARLSTEKENFAGLEAQDVARMVSYASEFLPEHGYEPYYLYRQKNMTENLENIGYSKPGREGLYNILIMEEVQMILALGSGASSKFTENAKYSEKRFGRVENVKNVAEYINRIDEMIERKKNAFQRRIL